MASEMDNTGPAEATTNDVITDLIKTLTDEKKHFDDLFKNTLGTLRSLQRDVKKMKPKKKQKSSNSGEDQPRRASGLDKPVVVSEQLRELLELEDKLYPRSEVNAMVTAYIRTNELMNPENKREIILDVNDNGKKLNDVLKPDQPLTFFNIQRYLKYHLTKPPEDNSLEVKNQEYVDKLVDGLNDLVKDIPEPEQPHVDLPEPTDDVPPTPRKVVKKKVLKAK